MACLPLIVAPIYTVDGLVQVQDSSKGGGSIKAALSDLTPLLLGGNEETEAEIHILKSRLVLDQVIDKMNLLITVRPKYFPLHRQRDRALERGSEEPCFSPAWLAHICLGWRAD